MTQFYILGALLIIAIALVVLVARKWPGAPKESRKHKIRLASCADGFCAQARLQASLF